MPQSSSSFALTDLSINPNPITSEIGANGILHRYYRLVDGISGDPVAGAFVVLTPVDSFMTDEQGIVNIEVPSIIIGDGSVGAMETFAISEISYRGNRHQLIQTVSFNSIVVDQEYTFGWKNSKYAELGISVLRVGKGEGFSLNLKEFDDSHYQWDSLHLVRQMKTKVGVEFKVGAPLKAKLGPAQFGAEASVEAFGVIHQGDEYRFAFPDYNNMDATIMYILFVDGNVSALDNVLIRLLGYILEFYGSDGLSVAFQNAYRADLGGLEIGGGAHAEAGFGLLGQPTIDVFIGVGGDVGIQFTGHSIQKYLHNENQVLFLVGLSGQGEASLAAGLHFPNFNGSVAISELPLYVTPLGLGATGEVGAGVEFGALFDVQSSFPEELSMEFSYNWGALNDSHERSTRYRMRGQELIQGLAENVDLLGGLFGIQNQGQAFVLSNSNITGPLDVIFGVAYELQRTQTGQATITYSQKRTNTMTVFAFEFEIEVGTAGIEASVGGEFSFKQFFEYEDTKGIWISGRHFPLEEYSEPSYSEAEYGQLVHDICQKVPMEIKIAAFLFNLLDLVGFKSSPQEEAIFYIVDSTVSLWDTTAYLTYGSSTFPDTLSQVECHSWGWWGSSPLSLKNMLTSSAALSYQRIRSAAEESRGMTYGYGGFYQFEPFNLIFDSTATLTMRFLEAEIEGFSETELAMYREDKSTQSWIFIGGTVDTISNTVTAPIDQLGTYTLAPRLPFGSFGLYPNPKVILADSQSTCFVVSDTILNNDGSVINDGMQFTVTVNGCAFLTVDNDTTQPGLQVHSKDGIIEFELRSGILAGKTPIAVVSSYGSAYGETEITLVDGESAPSRPHLDSLVKYQDSGLIDSVKVYWQANLDSDLKGYIVFYDTTLGPPYEGKATVLGESSPIDVGNRLQYTLTGLSAEKVHVSIKAYDISGNESEYAWEQILTSVSEIDLPVLPSEYELSQNYPNPFNPRTRIDFALPTASFVTLDVFNILGQRVKTLVNGQLSAGKKAVIWDGTNEDGEEVSSGVYFYRIKAEEFVDSKKMMLIR